ncbi:MAG: hypothetical protein WBD47_21525 [Phormidesmis sp.]
MVVSFWLISVLSAGVALEGLISPKKLMMDLPQPEAEVSSSADSNAFLSVEPESANDPANSTTARDPVTADAADSAQFPAWPLGALVGTCAAGCLAMSRRRAMARMAAVRLRGNRKGRSTTVRAQANPAARSGQPNRKVVIKKPAKSAPAPANSPTASTNSQSSANSKRTYRPLSRPQLSQPARNKPVTAEQATADAISVKRRRPRRRPSIAPKKPAIAGQALISRTTTAQQAIPTTRISKPRPVPHQKRRSTARGAGRQAVVSVVPASESHALDWTNGSLAHQLDVRPQRTASM